MTRRSTPVGNSQRARLGIQPLGSELVNPRGSVLLQSVGFRELLFRQLDDWLDRIFPVFLAVVHELVLDLGQDLVLVVRGHGLLDEGTGLQGG